MTTTDDRPTTDTTLPADPQPILPPITCAAWCSHQDGHPDMRYAVDQRCATEEARVHLDLADRDARNAHEYVGVYVQREGAAATPHVYLHFDEDIGAELTPQEARRLARHLRRMAAMATL